MILQTIEALELDNKRILYRADLNVPVNEEKQVTDFSRLTAILPTLKTLVEQKAKIILCSHFGRPQEKEERYSLKFLAAVLESLLNKNGINCSVSFVDDCIGEKVETAKSCLEAGDILLLENLRFYEEEKKNDSSFAEQLAQGSDLYINDAFSCAHRAHASIEAITHYLPSYPGKLMQQELTMLEKIVGAAEKPVWGIIGGSKISTKIGVLKNLVQNMDGIVIGGAMANVFLKQSGYEVGISLCDEAELPLAEEISQLAQKYQCEILLPSDIVIAKELSDNTDSSIASLDEMPQDQMILDIGPETLEQIKHILSSAKTVLWNGPVGAFEFAPFAKGSIDLAQFLAQQTLNESLITLAGGGDTLAALEKANVKDDLTYCSTAGGAFLEWLEGKTLPGVVPLLSSELKQHTG